MANRKIGTEFFSPEFRPRTSRPEPHALGLGTSNKQKKQKDRSRQKYECMFPFFLEFF